MPVKQIVKFPTTKRNQTSCPCMIPPQEMKVGSIGSFSPLHHGRFFERVELVSRGPGFRLEHINGAKQGVSLMSTEGETTGVKFYF